MVLGSIPLITRLALLAPNKHYTGHDKLETGQLET